MRTVTLNRNQILYGLLILSLGFTKSWLMTAEDKGSMAFASTSDAYMNVTREVVGTDGKKHAVTVRVRTHELGPQTIMVNGVQTVDPNLKSNESFGTLVTEAKEIGLCGTCIGEFRIVETSNQAALETSIDTILADKIAENAKKEKEAKALEIAIANCEKAKDGDKILDLEDDANRKQFFSCKADKIRNDDKLDRKERYAALKDLVANEIADRELGLSNDPKVRKETIAVLNDLKAAFPEDYKIRRFIDGNIKGAKVLASEFDIAKDSALNPTKRLTNFNELSAIAIANSASAISRNPYSKEQQEGQTVWSSDILAIARQAQENPEALTREYFADLKLPVNPDSRNNNGQNAGNNNGQNINSPSSQDRGTRQNIGQGYIPRYLDTNGNNNGNINNGNNGNNGGFIPNNGNQNYSNNGNQNYPNNGYRPINTNANNPNQPGYRQPPYNTGYGPNGVQSQQRPQTYGSNQPAPYRQIPRSY